MIQFSANPIRVIAGICHTDIHYAHNDFGITQYPLVGHGRHLAEELIRLLLLGSRA